MSDDPKIPPQMMKPGHELLAGFDAPAIAGEVGMVSAFAVDQRARAALELSALAVERAEQAGTGYAALARRLKAVAESCVEATRVAEALVIRAAP
jgi:hypothetical protein